VRRGSVDAARSLDAALRAVRNGECVAVYPEGTLTRDPGLWPMVGRTGAARIALSTGAPVIPIAQWGAQELLEPYGKRLHVLRHPLVHVWAGPAVDLSRWEGRQLDGIVLAEATNAILDAITALLEQIRGETAPAERWDPRRHHQPPTGNFRRPQGEPR
jgi:1-acyl-sn-glycerol-3-phosphate acyltransferase